MIFNMFVRISGLRADFLRAARRAFVLLDTFSFRGCYFHTLTVIPPLADVTPDPKLITAVIPSTRPTKGFPVLVFFLFCITLIVDPWCAF
ncbi:hypothetical protein Hanom_Chr06g00576441 [Helianthus anomalus]